MRQERWPVILAIILSVGIYGVVQSLTYPLLAILLTKRDYSGWLVGLNAAMMPTGMLVAGALAPSLISAIGIYRVIQSGLIGVSACMLLLYAFEHFASWMTIRFVSGVILTIIFVATDSCINELTDDRVRGRIVGLYSMSLSFGFILGPLILTLFGSQSAVPFLFAIFLPFGAVLMIFFVRRPINALEFSGKPTAISGFFRKIPVLILAVVCVAFADQSALSLLPLFGLAHKLSEADANFLVVLMTTGSFLLLFPISWLADVIPCLSLMAVCSLLGALLSFGIILLAKVPAALPIAVFVWGGIYYSIYSLTLVRVGQIFSKSDLVGATAACGVAWGVGGIFGTPVTGVAMDLMGPAGLFVTNGAFFAILSAFLFILVQMASPQTTMVLPKRSGQRKNVGERR